MQELLVKMGIPTYILTIYTDLGSSASLNIQIGKQLPNNVGLIYGLSVTPDGYQPSAPSKQILSLAEAAKIYLELKSGSLAFLQYLRLDQLVYGISTNAQNPKRFLDVNIPANFDFDQSSYINPESVVDKTIGLSLWYIDIVSYNDMVKKGVLKGSTIQTVLTKPAG